MMLGHDSDLVDPSWCVVFEQARRAVYSSLFMHHNIHFPGHSYAFNEAPLVKDVEEMNGS